ncbi:hypothetical protein MTO96_015030 [Rhipicephalus appendiculatus]
MPLTYYDDTSGRSANCEWQEYNNTEEIKLDDQPAQIPAPSPSLRKVFCVYDMLQLNADWLKSYKDFPFEYCTDIIVYSFYIRKADLSISPKRRTSIGGRPTLPFSRQSLTPGTASNVYITIGGSRADSPAISNASTDTKSVIKSLTATLRSHNYAGLNIDWDHPGDDCDKGRAQIMLDLVRSSAASGHRVLITLPPDAGIVELHYSAFLRALRQVEYLIIATHRLRPRGLVSCTGDQHIAASAFLDVRKLLAPTNFKNLAYSISLGGDIYFSKFQEFWTPSFQLSRFYDNPQGVPKD